MVDVDPGLAIDSHRLGRWRHTDQSSYASGFQEMDTP
jgi:hypothetical protein